MLNFNRFCQAAIATTLLSSVISPTFATESLSPAASLGGPVTPKVRVNTEDRGRDCQTWISLGLKPDPKECPSGGTDPLKLEIKLQKTNKPNGQPSDRIRVNFPVITFP
jgi:hypothetical protein